jgi:hypothetical protein
VAAKSSASNVSAKTPATPIIRRNLVLWTGGPVAMAPAGASARKVAWFNFARPRVTVRAERAVGVSPLFFLSHNDLRQQGAYAPRSPFVT